MDSQEYKRNTIFLLSGITSVFFLQLYNYVQLFIGASVCSHVAALLFKIDASMRLELNKVASTSQLCSWNKSRRQVDPAPLQLINFSHPKRHENKPKEKSNVDIQSHYSITNINSELMENLVKLKERYHLILLF